MKRKVILCEPLEQYGDVELDIDEFTAALTREKIYYCKRCTLERANDTFVWHLVGRVRSQEDYDQAVVEIKKG